MSVLFLIVAICAIPFSNGAPRDLHFHPAASDFETTGQHAWDLFKTKHAKTYPSLAEESRRMKIFEENLKEIESHNYLYEMGLKSYKMGVNQFTDMELSEVVMREGIKPSVHNRTNEFNSSTGQDAIPRSVDWRKHGYVTPVKNQGNCGSCWSFSTTGSVEGQHFRKTKKLVSLSEQNLIDCSTAYPNQGCQGGTMDTAFEYIKTNGGIDLEESYPYEAKVQECRYKKETRGATVAGYIDIKYKSETALTVAIAKVGPISVGILAKESLLKYKEGVYEDMECQRDPTKLNHAVLVVGYGSENGKDYYIIKNSWGTTWGEDGYGRIARNQGNMCGIASMASFPVVKDTA